MEDLVFTSYGRMALFFRKPQGMCIRTQDAVIEMLASVVESLVQYVFNLSRLMLPSLGVSKGS